MDFGNPGHCAEDNVFDTGLVAAVMAMVSPSHPQAGGDPEDIDSGIGCETGVLPSRLWAVSGNRLPSEGIGEKKVMLEARPIRHPRAYST